MPPLKLRLQSINPLVRSLFAVLCILLTACSPETQSIKNAYQKLNPFNIHDNAAQAISKSIQNLLISHALNTYSESEKLCYQLELAVHRFLRTPSSESLSEMQLSWQRAHDQYQSTLFFNFIETELNQYFQLTRRVNNRIDHWPYQPGYIDYMDLHPFSGIIADQTLPLNKTTLLAQHGYSHIDDITLGFHALQFLIWGESGKRPTTDYLVDSTDTPLSLSVKKRRIRHLELAANILRTDVSIKKLAWAQTGVFHQGIKASPPFFANTTFLSALKIQVNQIQSIAELEDNIDQPGTAHYFKSSASTASLHSILRLFQNETINIEALTKTKLAGLSYFLNDEQNFDNSTNIIKRDFLSLLTSERPPSPEALTKLEAVLSEQSMVDTSAKTD